MASFRPLSGVVPAPLLPFDSSLRIDERNYRRHVRNLLDTDGVTGITVNAHATEVATLTVDEQRRILAMTLEESAGKVPVINGVYEDGSAKAAQVAKAGERDGADALLIFPSAVFDFGSQRNPDIAYSHYATIAEATGLPMIAFVYPVASGLNIATDALVRICAEIDNVVSIKEWTNDIVLYERNYHALKALDKDVSVLSSFSRSLFASLCIGADGILSGHGSLVADLHVELLRAVEKQDLALARQIWARIRPVADVCYSDPFLDGHNRMKEALAILGRIDEAHVRPPLQSISEEERERIRQVVQAVGLRRGNTGG
jgi:4-hydroxy-tetrahydrodipicolinate synthase